MGGNDREKKSENKENGIFVRDDEKSVKTQLGIVQEAEVETGETLVVIATGIGIVEKIKRTTKKRKVVRMMRKRMIKTKSARKNDLSSEPSKSSSWIFW